MAQEGLICWSCGKITDITGRVMRSDCCDSCHANLRSCRGCRHFDPTRRYQCRETIDSPVAMKEKSNMCDFFQARAAFKTAGGMTGGKDDKEALKKKFDSLFDD